MDEIQELRRKYAALENKLGETERVIKDPAKRGYYALNKILYQQILFLEEFDLTKQVKENPKEDKVYERAKGIWEGLKSMILDCRALKTELKIPNDEEEKEIKKIYRLTPESVSDVLGNTAGQQG